MGNNKTKSLFISLIYIATFIVTIIGSTLAYFSATTASAEDAVSLEAAVYEINLIDDTSLIKAQIIPTAEKYVDIAIRRLDEDGNFIKPYKSDGKTITDKTVCIDDNLNEICSIYTFTVVNPMTNIDLPIRVFIKPTINTFTNMKYKIIKIVKNASNKYEVKELTEARWLVDDRYEIDEETGGYVKDEQGYKIEKPNFAELEISTIYVDGVNETLPKSPNLSNPSSITYSIVMWVEEIYVNQTKQDSGQIFAGGIIVETGDDNNGGITGVFSAGGVDNE